VISLNAKNGRKASTVRAGQKRCAQIVLPLNAKN